MLLRNGTVKQKKKNFARSDTVTNLTDTYIMCSEPGIRTYFAPILGLAFTCDLIKQAYTCFPSFE